MSRPDPAASAALDGDVLPIWLVYLDFADEPLRGCTAGQTLSFSGSGDPDLDGHTFDGINSQMIEVSDVSSSESGTDTVTVVISGIASLDADMLAAINSPAIYQGRVARLWRIIRDMSGAQVGGIQPYYTGYMVTGYVGSEPDEQTITIQIEGYISAHSAPSFRTYLDQESFDAGDLSARAAIAIANGVGADPSIGAGVSNPSGGGRMRGDQFVKPY
jgi:hypothetical protein